MAVLKGIVFVLLAFVLLVANVRAQAQQQQQSTDGQSYHRVPGADSRLTGVYRIDIASSDKLYPVIAGATSNLPFGEQQRFFIDLAARLTPPDLLAIERHGRSITIASSRAPRITFEADGTTHTERDQKGRVVRTSASISGAQLMVNSSGGTQDKFVVTFEPEGQGERLRVVRRIYAEELNQPIIIQSIYNRISEVAQWSIYGEPQTAAAGSSASIPVPAASTKPVDDEAESLRRALNEWVASTNTRDIDRLTTFYMTTLKAYYLTRNVRRSVVRQDKLSSFRRADVINVRADEPEILFSHSTGTAIMRFRKNYVTETRSRKKSGEVIQELRWQKTVEGWKIISERDIRVIR
jgi:nucleoid-associated protein YgaU